MIELNALKVTMLFPVFAHDGSPFPVQTWNWWLDSILAIGIGACDEFFTRGSWEGQLEYHRCVTMSRPSFEKHARNSISRSCTSRQSRSTSSSFNALPQQRIRRRRRPRCSRSREAPPLRDRARAIPRQHQLVRIRAVDLFLHIPAVPQREEPLGCSERSALPRPQRHVATARNQSRIRGKAEP